MTTVDTLSTALGWVAIDDLTLDHDRIQIRTALSRETVDKYADALEFLPPVEVFRVTETETDDDGKETEVERLILADGFHRVAAFTAMGQKSIPANVRTGTLEEAEEFAAVANATSGRQLTTSERNDAIRRVHRLHPRMKQADIATRLSVSQPTVNRILRMDKVRADHPKAVEMPDAQLAEIMMANGDLDPLIDAATKNDWTRAQIRTAVGNMKNPKVDAATRRDVLSGTIEPVKVKKDGSFERVTPGTVSGEGDPWDAVRTALYSVLDAEVAEIVAEVQDESLIGGIADKFSEARIAAARFSASERDGEDGDDAATE